MVYKRLGRLRIGLIGNDDFHAGQRGLGSLDSLRARAGDDDFGSLGLKQARCRRSDTCRAASNENDLVSKSHADLHRMRTGFANAEAVYAGR